MAERSAPIGALSSLRAIPCFRFTEIEGEPFHSMIDSEGASENATLCCKEENWRVFESICVSGEVMRLENQY